MSSTSAHTQLETHRNPLILRDDFFGRRLQCGTGLPACQRLTCVAPGTAIQVSPPNERRRPSAQVASQKPSCFVGQPILAPILAAAGFQPALFISRFLSLCRKRRSRQGSSIARVNATSFTASHGRISTTSREIPKTVTRPGLGQPKEYTNRAEPYIMIILAHMSRNGRLSPFNYLIRYS